MYQNFTEVIPLSNQHDADIQNFGCTSFRNLVESLTYLLISLFCPFNADFGVVVPYYDPRGNGADREGYVQRGSNEESSRTIIQLVFVSSVLVQFFSTFHWPPSLGKFCMTPVSIIKTAESYEVCRLSHRPKRRAKLPHRTRLCGPCIAAIDDYYSLLIQKVYI